MAKTNPIGVRFREDILESLKKDKLADSPQSALVFLERFYVTHKDKINPLDVLRQNEPKSSKSDTKLPKQEEKPVNELKISSGDISKLKKERDELINEMSTLGDNGIDKALKSSIQSRINQINSKIGD